jgi:hypothetical protein
MISAVIMNTHILFQRIEGAAIFAAATAVYFHSHLGWVWYVVLLFAFDIFMLGYMVNARIGALVYHLGHSLTIPALLAVVYLLHGGDVVLGLTCLWFAHVGIDRALGYGLKLNAGFKNTHLGTIGPV